MATNLEVMTILKEEIDFNSVDTVLDLGCGSFFNSNFDYKVQDIPSNMFRNKKITGIDIFKTNIDWRKKYGPPGIYECINILDFNFSEKYDIVFCHHVLEHFSQEEHDIVLEKIESSFTKYSILGGPVGYHDNTHHINQTGNIYEEHKIGLNPDVYAQLDYKIFLAIKEYI